MSKFDSILGHDCGLPTEVMPMKLKELMDRALSDGAKGLYRFLILGSDGSKEIPGSAVEERGELRFGARVGGEKPFELWKLKETNHDLDLRDELGRPLNYVKTIRIAETVVLRAG